MSIRRAQASAEYLLILGVLAAAILPFLLMLAWNANQNPEALALTLATFSASRLAASVNSVGSLGPGAILRTQIEMPDGVTMSARGREVVVHLNTRYGPVDIVQPTRFNMSSSGLERISAQGTYVIDVNGPYGLNATNVTLVLS